MDNSWCHFSTSYKALSQVPELRILVAISDHINMNIPINRSIQPVSLLILMRQFRIQSECQYYNKPRQAAANGAASDIEWSLAVESRSALHYERLKRRECETHPSELGNTELLTKLEHCPKTASIAIPAPFLESPP